MDFTLSEEQRMLRETARDLLAARWAPETRRQALEDPSVADGLWSDLREWTALAGGPLVDLCVFLEETGAVLAPGPFFATVGMFAPLAAAAGLEVAPRVASGQATGTVAIADAGGRWEPHDDPRKSFVLEADRVEAVLAVAPGPTVTLIEAPPAQAHRSMDLTRRMATVDTEGGRRLEGPVRIDPRALEDCLARATVALAAELCGTTRWLFETTLEYTKVREQFDRPIGSFQALQHRLADMALSVERAWSAMAYAAMTIDADDPDRRRAVHVAKAAAGAAALHNAREGMQMHGGIGFTWEHDLHLYLRRAYSDEQLLGSSDEHRDRLADLMLPLV